MSIAEMEQDERIMSVNADIVALPAGIVTAGYMDELNNSKKNKDDTRE